MRALSTEVDFLALDEDQQEKLTNHCVRTGSKILKIYATARNYYVILSVIDPTYIGHNSEETRYWYSDRSRVHYSGKKIHDVGRWKLVG